MDQVIYQKIFAAEGPVEGELVISKIQLFILATFEFYAKSAWFLEFGYPKFISSLIGFERKILFLLIGTTQDVDYILIRRLRSWID